MAKKKFYAVQSGRVPGVYLTWEECKKQVDGFSGAVFKSFPTKEEAERFAAAGGNRRTGGTPASEEEAADLPGKPSGLADFPAQSGEEKTARLRTASGELSSEEWEVVNLPEAQDETPGTGEEPEAVAYVDGSYYHPDRRFSCGVVMFWKGQELHFREAWSDPELASMRNVAGEIKGAMKAMEFCLEHGIRSLCIYHDYEGISKWCEGQWEAKKEGTRAYREFYRQASEKVKITFRKVKGHSGDRWNDLADRLAKEALDRPVG